MIIMVLLGSALYPSRNAAAALQTGGVTPFDLIIAMNTIRVSNGLSALVEDGLINAVAQSTAEIMAANQMSWHIGDVSGRLASAGYGGGAKVWATENFAVGSGSSIDEILLAWSDASHMIPALNPAYCNVGAGVATAPDGMVYYVLQAAYTSGKSCGEYNSPVEGGTSGGSAGANTTGVSQVVVPVKIASPDADGKVFHVVEAGQSFWSIAVTYQITINDLEVWNNLSRDSGLRIGQRLFIPGSNTVGYSTPTPVGMFAISTPDLDGRIVHTVAAYQTLTSISESYGVEIASILALNGIQKDWPLQVGQQLVISAGSMTPSPTQRPLTPIEKLTPASDGMYYHEIRSGQTLSGIAGLYKIPENDLMNWNGLNASSTIYSGQRLVLMVTPPATPTRTPAPATATRLAPTATATLLSTRSAASPTVAAAGRAASSVGKPLAGIVLIVLAALGLGAAAYFLGKRRVLGG